MTTILCIDDNRMSFRFIKKLLSRIGFEVISAETAWDGIQKAKSGQSRLILINVDLPDMDGLELVRRLQADDELMQIPIIPMVNAAKPQFEDVCEIVACDDVLRKPIVAQDLYTVVRRHIPEAFDEVVWFSEV